MKDPTNACDEYHNRVCAALLGLYPGVAGAVLRTVIVQRHKLRTMVGTFESMVDSRESHMADFRPLTEAPRGAQNLLWHRLRGTLACCCRNLRHGRDQLRIAQGYIADGVLGKNKGTDSTRSATAQLRADKDLTDVIVFCLDKYVASLTQCRTLLKEQATLTEKWSGPKSGKKRPAAAPAAPRADAEDGDGSDAEEDGTVAEIESMHPSSTPVNTKGLIGGLWPALTTGGYDAKFVAHWAHKSAKSPSE